MKIFSARGRFVLIIAAYIHALGWMVPFSLQAQTGAAVLLRVKVGEGVKLNISQKKKAQQPDWKSSADATVECLQNGWIIGLQPGQALVTAQTGPSLARWTITVAEAAEPPRTVQSIKQFPDMRRFQQDGRTCVGTELNGHVPGVPNKNVLESNRIINPKHTGTPDELLWDVLPHTEVLDGAGRLMGTVAPKKGHHNSTPASAFNFGMTKIMRGRLYLYGFGTSIEVNPALQSEMQDEIKNGMVDTSAWVPFDAVVDKELLIERYGIGRGKLPALPVEARTHLITGGNPKAYVLPQGELAIVKAANGPVPSHYLRRPSGTINILYSVPGYGLGGQGLDSFLLSDHPTFRAAIGIRPLVQPTYFPKNHPRAREEAQPTMTFLYGAIEVAGNRPVFGWVAKEALAATP